MADPARGTSEYSKALKKQEKADGRSKPHLNTTLTELRQRRVPMPRGGSGKSDVEHLIDSWKGVTARALEFLDDKALAAATAKELADVATKGTQNIQLLKGLPTKILGLAERSSMDKIMKMAMLEAKKRHLVDLPAEDYVDITPKD